jgi:hypothetical protein
MTLFFQGRTSPIAHSSHQVSRLVKLQEKSWRCRWEEQQVLTALQMIVKLRHTHRQSGIFSWEVQVAHVLSGPLFWTGNYTSTLWETCNLTLNLALIWTSKVALRLDLYLSCLPFVPWWMVAVSRTSLHILLICFLTAFTGTTLLQVRFLMLYTTTVADSMGFISASMSLPWCLHWYHSEPVWIWRCICPVLWVIFSVWVSASHTLLDNNYCGLTNYNNPNVSTP